jgi:hypothetical protein
MVNITDNALEEVVVMNGTKTIETKTYTRHHQQTQIHEAVMKVEVKILITDHRQIKVKEVVAMNGIKTIETKKNTKDHRRTKIHEAVMKIGVKIPIIDLRLIKGKEVVATMNIDNQEDKPRARAVIPNKEVECQKDQQEVVEGDIGMISNERFLIRTRITPLKTR